MLIGGELDVNGPGFTASRVAPSCSAGHKLPCCFALLKVLESIGRPSWGGLADASANLARNRPTLFTPAGDGHYSTTASPMRSGQRMGHYRELLLKQTEAPKPRWAPSGPSPSYLQSNRCRFLYTLNVPCGNTK